MLAIPGTPPDCTLLAGNHHAVAAPTVATLQVAACDNTVISSLTHSDDSMASKLEILSHELIKIGENEVCSDPTVKSYVHTKCIQCKACGKKSTFKCSKFIHTVALCNISVCLGWHQSKLWWETSVWLMDENAVEIVRLILTGDESWLGHDWKENQFWHHRVLTHATMTVPFYSLTFKSNK